MSPPGFRHLLEKDVIASQMDNVALALFLAGQMLRSDPPSTWRPYLDVLPRSFSTPLYYTEEQLQVRRIENVR